MTLLPAAAALRILCAVAFVPHLLGKIRDPAASVDLFRTVGLRPPLFWIRTAVAIELSVALCLLLDIATVYAALAGGILLFVAGAAILRVTGGKWRWNEGGGEFPLFWGSCCFLVALQAWA